MMDQVRSFLKAFEKAAIAVSRKLFTFHVPHVFRSSGFLGADVWTGRKFLGVTVELGRSTCKLWQFGVIYNQFAGSPIWFTHPSIRSISSEATTCRRRPVISLAILSEFIKPKTVLISTRITTRSMIRRSVAITRRSHSSARCGGNH